MKRIGLSLMTLLMFTATPVFGHFVFIVPDIDGKTLRIVFSESLEPDEGVALGPVAKLELSALGVDQKATAVELKAEEHSLTGKAPMRQVVYGSMTYGVMTRGGQSFLLQYHPKAILRGVPADRQAVATAAFEIVPESSSAGVRFRVMARGGPAEKVDVTVLLPDGESKKVATDAQGWTPAFSAAGRYGAWARVAEKSSGEHDGKTYSEIRHYPTLVTTHSPFTPLPEAVSSFGAAVSGEWVYVYGGHRAEVHTYDTNAVTGGWRRLNWKSIGAWEELTAGPSLQGLALVAHDGNLIRIGGMAPINSPGQPTDNRSTDSCAMYEVASKAWKPLPSLPQPRSSHDAVIVGDRLYVVGGWNMSGRKGNVWFDDALVLDLKMLDQGWKSLAQPFRRRALQAAVHRDRVFVIGGLTEDGSVDSSVNIFDPAEQKWTSGPELLGDDKAGFSPGACTVAERLYVSVGDGTVARLSDDGKNWESFAKVLPRIVHRMVPTGDRQMLLLGGAHRLENLDTVEPISTAHR